MSETLRMISKLQYNMYHFTNDDCEVLLKRIRQRVVMHKLLLKNQINNIVLPDMILSFCTIAKFKINSLKQHKFSIQKNGN